MRPEAEHDETGIVCDRCANLTRWAGGTWMCHCGLVVCDRCFDAAEKQRWLCRDCDRERVRRVRESTVVRGIINAVKAAFPRAYVRKLSDRHHRGLPDLLIIFPALLQVGLETMPLGQTLMVEAKTDTGRVEPIQEAEHGKIRRAGGEVMVARSADEVLARMRALGAVA